MRQVLEIQALRCRKAPTAGWFGRLYAGLLGPRGRKRTLALDHYSAHLLRDIGLPEDRRDGCLLRDDLLFRR